MCGYLRYRLEEEGLEGPLQRLGSWEWFSGFVPVIESPLVSVL